MPVDPRTGLEMQYPPATSYPMPVRPGVPQNAWTPLPPTTALQPRPPGPPMVQAAPQSGLGLNQANVAGAAPGQLAPQQAGPPMAQVPAAPAPNALAGVDPEYLALMQGASLFEDERVRDVDQDLSEFLTASSLRPVRGGMQGNVYVPASWSQGAAKILQAYAAKRARDRSEAKGAKTATKRDKLRQQFFKMLEKR